MAIKYIHEARHGIPVARNTGIRNIPDDFNSICFIDDDEFPDENWIHTLLEKQQKLNADCIAASVIPILPKDAPAWVVKSKVFDGWNFKNEMEIKKAASNNVLISLDFIRKNNLSFNENMSTTGGSDFHFFKLANDLGMRIFWTSEAPVYEDIPPSRLTLRWLIQRQFRLGNTFAVSAWLSKSWYELLSLSIKGFCRIVLGILVLPLSIFSYSIARFSLIHIVRGAGILLGVFGGSINEYSKKNLKYDRNL
jgi:glycosyltransferase involved in cell wall biosynthesis